MGNREQRLAQKRYSSRVVQEASGDNLNRNPIDDPQINKSFQYVNFTIQICFNYTRRVAPMKYFKTVLTDEINEITEFMYIYCIIIYCYVANYPKT